MTSTIKVDTISENTSANGVAVDGVTLKDGGGTFTSPVLVPDGSTSAVSLGNDGDPNTGIYFQAADSLGLVLGGSRKLSATSAGVAIENGTLSAKGGAVFNEDSADVDFRVESNGNANMLFVDGGNDNVSIGTSAVVENFGSDRTHLTIRSASSGNYSVLAISGHADNNDQIHGLINFYNETTSVARIVSQQESNTSDAYLAFLTAPSSGGIAERIRIHGGGVVSIPNGIALGVGTANTASNVLDDFEEGNWTMGISDGTNTATLTGSGYNVGRYFKTGNKVYVQGFLDVQSIGSCSGNLKLTGLPFTAANAPNAYGAVLFGYGAGLSITAGTNLAGYVEGNNTLIELRTWDATTGTTPLQHSELSTGEFIFSATYYVS